MNLFKVVVDDCYKIHCRVDSPASNSMSSCSSSYSSNTDERGIRQSFFLRLKEKPLAKNDAPQVLNDSNNYLYDFLQYEHMHVVGHMKRMQNIKGKKVNVLGENTFLGVMKPVRDRCEDL